MIAALAAPASMVGFFAGAATSAVNNFHILTDQQVSDLAFLTAVTVMKDAGMLKVIMGSGIATLGTVGLVGSAILGIGWGISASNNGAACTRLGMLTGCLFGGAASLAALSYGSYKLGDGLIETSLAMISSALRK